MYYCRILSVVWFMLSLLFFWCKGLNNSILNCISFWIFYNGIFIYFFFYFEIGKYFYELLFYFELRYVIFIIIIIYGINRVLLIMDVKEIWNNKVFLLKY